MKGIKISSIISDEKNPEMINLIKNMAKTILNCSDLPLKIYLS